LVSPAKCEQGTTCLQTQQRKSACQLASAGALVVLADIDETRAYAAAAEIANAGGTVMCSLVDVTDSLSVRRLIDGAAAEFGRVDYMFNNAGISVWGEVRDLTLQDWRRALDVNLVGVIYGIHYAYPLMIKQGFHIVNTASALGIVPSPLCGPYVASKFAVFGISNALRLEARGFGIGVTVVCPGFIKTEIMANTINPVNTDPEIVRALLPVKGIRVQRAAQLMLAGVARKKQL
jgi:NAD(P)-dependent dehydrogenase (short-subunit alcohol dehydrogenase family)